MATKLHRGETKAPPSKRRELSLERFASGPLADTSVALQREALISTNEVAQLLGVSKLTVTRWRSSGDVGLHYSRLRGNQVRYRLGDVLDWINERRVRHTAEEKEKRPQGLYGVVGKGWGGGEGGGASGE